MELDSCSPRRKIADFEKLEFIGRGGYGEVRKVKDRKSGEVFALKRIKFSRGREIPLSAHSEIELLKNMNHENIVKFVDVVGGHSEGKICILVEYCGSDLANVLENLDNPLKEQEIKCILLQLFNALDYIHKSDIIHRDINPANILFKGYSHLKICDFGSAKKQSSQPLSPEAGTLWYRAPELLLGSNTYKIGVDIWAAGCVFAELLTLEALFPGQSEIEQINLIISLLGTPNEETMPGFSELPAIKNFDLKIQPVNQLSIKFKDVVHPTGNELLHQMLKFGESARITASECLCSEYMKKEPCACSLEDLRSTIFNELK